MNAKRITNCRTFKRGFRASRIAWLLAGLAALPLAADELELDAETLFQRGVTEHLRMAGDPAAIELDRGVLYEDDGPAAGYSYQPNEEKLDSNVCIKKELIIPAPRAAEATLLVGTRGDLTARINGRATPLQSLGKQGNYWSAFRFPPDILRAGQNEFVLSGNGTVWIARDDEYAAGSVTRQSHPNRSAKSNDAGRTWNDSSLGTKNDIDGEYYVRVFLDQHQPRGRLTLAVVDCGNLAGSTIGPPVSDIGPIRISANVDTKKDCSIQIRARTGSSFVPNEKNWSDWSIVDTTDGAIAKPAGRYLQLELNFATEDPLTAPKLHGLTIAASPRRPIDWTQDLAIVELDNQQIVRSSIPFQYEPFDRPELAELRRTHELDKVVAGADSEFELIQCLAAWSATRWQRMHLKESYPAYNALEILKPHDDGTPVGGFCQQYNVVFLQACESFGLVGRLVSIGPGNKTDTIRGGHEIAEIWSNELRKWIYVDGNTGWYAKDRETNVPLSLWELRERQLAAFAGESHEPIEVVKLADTKHEWPDLTHWPPFVELRLIPRSNFLEELSPLPLNQGMRGWFWTGHYVWTDKKMPARMFYSNRVAKRANFEWTLNQAQLAFESTGEPGTLRVHVDTNTPGFAEFHKTIDGAATTDAANTFLWKLHDGKNSLCVVPRNTAGREGVASWIVINR